MWSTRAKEELKKGNSVKIRPKDNSMTGRIESGQEVTLVPVKIADIGLNDIVLVTVKRIDYLHLVKAIDGERLLIGNNKGKTNGWTNAGKLYGKVVKVEQ